MLWQSSSINAQRAALYVAMPHTCPTVGFTAAGSADEQSKRPNLGTRWRC